MVTEHPIDSTGYKKHCIHREGKNMVGLNYRLHSKLTCVRSQPLQHIINVLHNGIILLSKHKQSALVSRERGVNFINDLYTCTLLHSRKVL